MGEELKHSELLEALDYNKETGVFTWKKNRPLKHFKSEFAKKVYETRFGGKEAGYKYYIAKVDNTYIQIRLFTKLYLGHRLAWFYETGEWPTDIVDHLDGNGSNNSFINLRVVTNTVNSRNCFKSKNNTSGVNGVWFHGQNKNWVAEGHYTENGIHKKKTLGSFKKLEDAAVARRKWEESEGNFTERHGK